MSTHGNYDTSIEDAAKEFSSFINGFVELTNATNKDDWKNLITKFHLEIDKARQKLKTIYVNSINNQTSIIQIKLRNLLQAFKLLEKQIEFHLTCDNLLTHSQTSFQCYIKMMQEKLKEINYNSPDPASLEIASNILLEAISKFSNEYFAEALSTFAMYGNFKYLIKSYLIIYENNSKINYCNVLMLFENYLL